MPNGEVKICIKEEEVKTLVKILHDHQGRHLSTDLTLKFVLIGPYWRPTIYNDIYFACDIICHTCKQRRRNEKIGVNRVILVLVAEAVDPSDWRLPYIEYLENGRIT
jgi:hypothetical protein